MPKEIPKYGQIAIDAAKESAKLAVGPLGAPAVDLVVRLGRDLIASSSENLPNSSTKLLERLKREEIEGSKAPAIIGLGRCGCRVTASLAKMIAQARGDGERNVKESLPNWLGVILKSKDDRQAYTLDPILVVGDLNANTFGEIRGILQTGSSKAFSDKLLVLDYRPLASDGAGNIPVFGEFFTRALLSLSPEWQGQNSDWHLARSYLIEYFANIKSAPKLAFYIFGAAGGSGSGGAMELLRAQRTIMAVTTQQTPRIYMSGITVIPDDSEINDHQLRNTGRLIIQYLADLDVTLSSTNDYSMELQPKYGTVVKAVAETSAGPDKGRKVTLELPIPPWDSVGIISNQVMTAITNPGDHQIAVDERANQYIAQQIFNLAYSQSAADALTSTKDVNFDESTVFLAANKLDVEDLINGISGPYAIGFSASEAQALENEGGVDAFFLRAIGLPSLYPSKANPKLDNTIQGLSISPQRREIYIKAIQAVRAKNEDAKGNQKPLVKEDFNELNKILFYLRCPRIIIVLTSPANNQITNVVKTRITQLGQWAFPNLKQARFATIAGATPFYSLSIYMEGSVIHSYDVRKAIVFYLFSSWKQRSPDAAKAEEFSKQYQSLIEKDAPITDEEITEWLGEEELYGDNINAWETRVTAHEENWRKFIETLPDASEADKTRLRQHDVQSCLLTPKHVACALRYINYMRHTGKIVVPPTPDE